MTLATALFLATLLGSLAFFEPCTVAVHALYMERSSRTGTRGCWRASLVVWVVRILLVGLPLLLAVGLLPPLTVSREQAALVLALMGLLYIVSRQHYIPVPHLALHRLLPGGDRLPQGVRLGLTLPACTLPLYVVLLGVVLEYHSWTVALLAGLLFASFFTLPMLLVTLHGMHRGGSRLLAGAALVTPYLTAGLLFLAALWFVWPSLVSSAGNLQGALEQASWAAGSLLGCGAGAGTDPARPHVGRGGEAAAALVRHAGEKGERRRRGVPAGYALLGGGLPLLRAGAAGGDHRQRRHRFRGLRCCAAAGLCAGPQHSHIVGCLEHGLAGVPGAAGTPSGELATASGLSRDTLRYYERLGLLQQVGRDPGGRRVYGERHLSTLHFIRRAQSMGFSLEEIGKLLQFRQDPTTARSDVRELMQQKLKLVEQQLQELQLLRNEMLLLLNLCGCVSDSDACPILDSLEES